MHVERQKNPKRLYLRPDEALSLLQKKIAPCGSPCGFCTLQHSHKRKLKRPRSTTPQTKNHHNNTEIPQTWPINKLVHYVSGTTITAASSWHRRTCGKNIRRINSWTRLAHRQFSKQKTWNTKRVQSTDGPHVGCLNPRLTQTTETT